MSRRILFVCLGNICRSPTAEGVFAAIAAARGLDVAVDSAGTSDWHVGDPPDRRAIAAAAAAGYDISGLRARQVAPADFDRFDLIVAMDAQNLARLRAMRPAGARAEFALMLDFAPDLGLREVPDPWMTGDFDGALRLIEAAARGLADQLA